MKNIMHNKSYLFVIPTLGVGGAERQVVSQVNELYKKGIDVTLVVLSKLDVNNNILIELKLPKDKYIFLESDVTSLTTVSLIKMLFLIPTFSSILYEKGIKIVVSNLPIAHNFVRFTKIYYYLIYSKKIKLIHYHHSLQYQASPLNTFRKRIFNFVISILAGKLDNGNIFISTAAKVDVSSNLFVDDSKACIIHNAIPKVAVDSLLANKYLEDNQIKASYLILLPGRLAKDKGQIEFIDVFYNFLIKKSLKPKDVKVIIAGGGNLKIEIINKINSLRIKDYFFISGSLNNSLLLSLMQRSNLVVIPSINEGFGIVAIEALLAGSLILASDAGGLKEIIIDKKNGYLFNSGNWRQLEEKLNFIYQNSDNIRVNKEYLLRDFDERFCFENHIQRLESYLLKFL
jgi:glycosyltransferase involved in cell wall biosynthesis